MTTGPRRRQVGAWQRARRQSPSAAPSRRGSAAPSNPCGRDADAAEAAGALPDPHVVAARRRAPRRAHRRRDRPRSRSRRCGCRHWAARSRCADRRASRRRATMVLATSVMMAGPPAEPTASSSLPSGVEHQGRRHRRKRPLAGLDPVRDRPAIDLGHEREIGQLVVEQEAAHHDARAEIVLDRRRHGDRVAVAVDDREVAGRGELRRRTVAPVIAMHAGRIAGRGRPGMRRAPDR